MIVTVKTYIDKTAFLIIPDPSVFASAFTVMTTEALEDELERIQGIGERVLTKKQFEKEVGRLPTTLWVRLKDQLPKGIEASFEFTDRTELVITIKGVSTLITSTTFH